MATAGRGFKVNDTWVVEVADHIWHMAEMELRDLLVRDIKEHAKLEGCTAFTIFAMPDPIFPMYGHTHKKKVYGENFAASSSKYNVQTTYVANIQPNEWRDTPEHLRPVLLRKIRDELNERGMEHPGKYQIRLSDNDDCYNVLERGRV